MANERKYIYCVIPVESEATFNHTGIEEESRIYTISYQDVAVVVSDTSLTICDPTRKNMAAHNRVLQVVMKDYTVLPARFGLISDSADELRGLLARYYSLLKGHIRKLDNRMEVGVKVFWKKEAMIAILDGKSQKITKLKEAIKTAPPARAQGLAVKAGDLVKSMAAEWQAKYGDSAYARLMRLAIDGRRNYPVDISNILNASFLVDKAKEEQFDAAIDELDSGCDERLDFKYVRPVPPYNFVSIEMYLPGIGG